ncbi:hypothetical protein ED733_005623 [Metarhizium rileyi]|uniref:Uncharacterized protein n=1 Tax=Metarhizium rileyi (strain RCEF 4871) TaxID=1649241 RepID=A0A5C6GJ23_METRR|nr:hypothetical protein ED733_005623 [Metarhizium rileyi]
MEDPNWAWPAWKFGMKENDLFTNLHDQYNTLSFTLQDPDAFHHDVYEISREAETAHEFHRMMADRRQMRLQELNESLETLAFEIIANPKLMGTDQWQHALQLFRTKSYDSIVRYFASYLPEDSFDRHDALSTLSASLSEIDTISTAATSVNDAPSPFMDADDYFFNSAPLTAESDLMKDKSHNNPYTHVTSSPPHLDDTQSEPSVSSSPSEAECSDSLAHSLSRSMSFSGSESRHVAPELVRQGYFEKKLGKSSQSDEFVTAITSLCESFESTAAADVKIGRSHTTGHDVDLTTDDDEDIPTAQYPDDEFEHLDYVSFINCLSAYDTTGSDTTTPRPKAAAASYVELRSVTASSKKAPSHQHSPSPKCCSANRGTGSPPREVRRSPEESLSKIQKPVQDVTRKRSKARRRID